MQLTELADKIHDLPTPPSVALQINNETTQETITARSLAVIIAQDPPLASKVMRLANSSYYGLAKQVDTLDRAVTVLGTNTIKDIALALSVSSLFIKDSHPLIDIEGLWLHDIACGIAAKCIITTRNPTEIEKAFLAGIIHDIGTIVLLNNFPEEMNTVFQKIHETGMRQTEAEKSIIGFSHEEAGGLLAEKWRFPQELVETIRYHHSADILDFSSIGNKTLISAVIAANQIVKIMNLGKSIAPPVEEVPKIIWKTLGIKGEDIPELRRSIVENFDMATPLFAL